MKNSISRFIIISLVLMCLMGALIYKLREVTIVEGAQYAEAAANTSTRLNRHKGHPRQDTRPQRGGIGIQQKQL